MQRTRSREVFLVLIFRRISRTSTEFRDQVSRPAVNVVFFDDSAHTLYA
jgi:hypothetical protein